MKQIRYIAGFALVLIVSSISASSFAAQATESKSADAELADAITRMDKAMFDAFNSHNVDLLMSMFTDDVEFYHDKGGLTNHQQTREGFTGMFGRTPDIRRDLVKGSLQVYPIKDYGAIEIGTHRFCHKENGNSASPARTDCGNFPFVMVWRKIGEAWKVSRVISYGH